MKEKILLGSFQTRLGYSLFLSISCCFLPCLVPTKFNSVPMSPRSPTWNGLSLLLFLAKASFSSFSSNSYFSSEPSLTLSNMGLCLSWPTGWCGMGGSSLCKWKRSGSWETQVSRFACRLTSCVFLWTSHLPAVSPIHSEKPLSVSICEGWVEGTSQMCLLCPGLLRHLCHLTKILNLNSFCL